MPKSRDQKLAEKLRAKQGNTYESASARARRQSAEASSVSDPAPTPSATYDDIRNTPESRKRRARSKSAEGISRWRRSVDAYWNR